MIVKFFEGVASVFLLILHLPDASGVMHVGLSVYLSVRLSVTGVNPLVSTVSEQPQFSALWCPHICGHPQNF